MTRRFSPILCLLLILAAVGAMGGHGTSATATAIHLASRELASTTVVVAPEQVYDVRFNSSIHEHRESCIGFSAAEVVGQTAGAWRTNTSLTQVGIAADATDAFPAFTQTTAGVAFKTGPFQDAAIGDIARALRAGTVSPSDLPINVLDRGEGLLGFDTRSMLALRQANIPLSDWTLIDQTGNDVFESALSDRLADNGLTNAGTDTLRITGAGQSASWWDGAP